MVADLADDKEMELKGNVQKSAGKVQAGLGNAKEDVKEA